MYIDLITMHKGSFKEGGVRHLFNNEITQIRCVCVCVFLSPLSLNI